MSKTEFPTEQRIGELRAQGYAPLSILSSRLFGLSFATLVVHLILTAQGKGIHHYFLNLKTESPLVIDKEYLNQFSASLLELIILPILVYLLVSVLWSLIQTKFMVTPSKVAFNLGRLWRSNKESGRAPAVNRFFSKLCWCILSLGLSLGGSLLVAYVFLGELGSLLNLEQIHIATSFKKLETSIMQVIFASGFFLAIALWLTGRHAFLMKHRMSRVEIEQEAKGN